MDISATHAKTSPDRIRAPTTETLITKKVGQSNRGYPGQECRNVGSVGLASINQENSKEDSLSP